MATTKEVKTAFKIGYLKKMAKYGITPGILKEAEGATAGLGSLLPYGFIGAPLALGAIAATLGHNLFEKEPGDVEETKEEILLNRYKKALQDMTEANKGRKMISKLVQPEVKTRGSRLLR